LVCFGQANQVKGMTDFSWEAQVMFRILAHSTALMLMFSGMFVPVHTVSTATSGNIDEGDVMRQLGVVSESLQRPPVDAKIDRVWHAIPGLSGWKLEKEQSWIQTRQATDRKIHLVWVQVSPRQRLQDLRPSPIYRGPNAERSIALMFNVSWGENYIIPILTTLRQQHVHATFFLDGAFVKKYPGLVKEIAADGHVIGSHGTGHPDFRKLSSEGLRQQIVGTNQTIKNATGVDVHLIAPPAGAYDQRLVTLSHQYHSYVILWTVDTIDWRRPPANTIIQRVIGKAEPGALVLMHPTASTAAALPSIIRDLRGKGYQLKTVESIVKEVPASTPPTSLSSHS
jgi:probable sporulation protein (polysaccharide deacetylase family)